MSILEWECFEDIINSQSYQITEPGILHHPVSKLRIKRKSSLQIELVTESDHSAIVDENSHPLGTVRKNEDHAVITSEISGRKVFLYGIGSTKTLVTDSFNSTALKRVETAEIHSVEGYFKDEKCGEYLIEWLDNIDGSYYIWPDSVRVETGESLGVCFRNSALPLELSSSQSEGTFTRNCVYLNVEGNECYLCKSIKTHEGTSEQQGFIIYQGFPSKKVRKKIRNCISYSLGRPLIYLGNTVLDSKFSIVSFYAISAYNYDGKAPNLTTSPPAPIGNRGSNDIDSQKLSRIVNALYKNYEDYNVGFLLWQYWHAICAPVHMAAVHFGAAIEALKKTVLEKNEDKIQTSLLGKDDWKKFNAEARQMLDGLSIDERSKSVIRNKMGSLNQAPQGIVTERFYQFLEIEFGEQESSAWNRRNDAAHGNVIEDGDYIDLIRDIKILKVMFDRILLKCTEGSDCYVDYYSFNHPIRPLQQGIPPDE